MTENKPQKTKSLPPLLFPPTTRTEQRRLSQLKAQGKIRRIGPRLYTSVASAKVAETVRAHWSTVVSTLFPDALLSHRTALEFRPGPENQLYLTATTNREIAYPGLRLIFIRGPGPLADDGPFLSLCASSLPRALLENLTPVRGKHASRIVDVDVIEGRLEQVLRDGGEASLNRLRDRAREIARQLGWKKELDRLDGMIGALLGTRPAANLASPVARARAAGEPYDPARLETFGLLFGELRNRAIPEIRDPFETPEHFRNKAFFEAYFSNFIEGTTFEIEEAEEIVFNRKIPSRRPKDAHDIQGTFGIVSDPNEYRRAPRDFTELQALLRDRHRRLMEYRPEALPGEFKAKVNRAGDTVFVHPDFLAGTLRRGHEIGAGLKPGLARAIFMMFLVAEVHPFADGNGRIARIMMNAELLSAGLSTLIIPNVYREDYLLALRALTRRHRPAPLVDMLLKAQRFSTLEFSPYPKILKDLQRRNWFREPNEARLIE